MKFWPGSVLRSAGIVGLATLLAVTLSQLSVVGLLERLTEDLRVSSFQAPMPQSKDIVVVAVTEETLRRFKYRSPTDRRFLAGLLERIDRASPRAIGLDILLDQATEADKDEALLQALHAMRTPIFVSYTRSSELVDEHQIAFLEAYLPASIRATAEFLRDPVDGTVRWGKSGRDGKEGREPPGLAVSIAAQSGVPAPQSALEIAWRSRPNPETPAFAIHAAHSIESLSDDHFRNKMVLIGGIVSMEDRYRTPLSFANAARDPLVPGILIHAHALSQLVDGRRIQRPAPSILALVSGLLALAGYLIAGRRRNLLLSVTASLALIATFWLAALVCYRMTGSMVPLITPSLAMLLSVWFGDLLHGRNERLRRRFLQQAFSRYVSPAVVTQLIAQPDDLKVAGQRREASFIFTDITGFTSLAERLSPEALSNLLNDYLDGCCRVIFEYGGTIDKFIGDSVMAAFNVPLAQGDHRERALRCAIAIDQWAEQFRLNQSHRGIELGATRIGVHAGVAIVGNFGSHSRMEFTALGDTVNIASRVEGMNRQFGTRLICTEAIASACPSFSLIDLGPIHLTGRSKPIRLYTPAALASSQSSTPNGPQATAPADRSASIASAE